MIKEDSEISINYTVLTVIEKPVKMKQSWYNDDTPWQEFALGLQIQHKIMNPAIMASFHIFFFLSNWYHISVIMLHW